jgi:hypothetical protein
MVIRRWQTQEMIGLSKSLVSPTHSYGKTIRRIPELAGMLPRLTSKHEQLVASHGDTIASRQAPIIAALLVADNRHDNWNRVLFYTLEAHIYKARAEDNEALSVVLEQLRDTLFPDRLEVVGYSYRAEAGQVEILAVRLTSDIQDTLAEIPVHKSNLLQVAHAIIAAGRELGALEEQRSRVREQTRATTPAVARHEWGRVMGVLRQLLEMNRGTDAGVDEILTRIEDIDRRAAQRNQAGSPDADSDVDSNIDDPAGEDPAGEDPAGEDPAGEDPANDDPANGDPAAGDEPGDTLLAAVASRSDIALPAVD